MPASGLQEIRLSVVATQPRGIVSVAERTEIELRPPRAALIGPGGREDLRPPARWGYGPAA
ncbi:hypothetical protein [Methylobacterium sp. PvR107]|uniref:hypothetical protein n=1 Tax=Methylobacterium sp. PvR107 TaxID=2806597 RepID=UPI0039182AD1